jgi:hypothetical protein
MTDIQNHPDVEELLLLVDESVPTRANRWVRRHVAACWKCRSHLDELQETVREFARYHEKALLPNLPAPPQPWPDLRPKMQQMDEANPMPDLWSRTVAYMSLRSVLALNRLVICGIVLSCVALALTLAFRTGKRPEAAPKTTTPVSSPKVAPAAPAVPPVSNHAALTTPPAPDSADTEVRIFAALHSIGADLGDPIEVSSDSQRRFKVTGIGLASQRQRDARCSHPTAGRRPRVLPGRAGRGLSRRELASFEFRGGPQSFRSAFAAIPAWAELRGSRWIAPPSTLWD